MCSSASNDCVYVNITVPSSVGRGTSDDWIVDADDLVAVSPDDWIDTDDFVAVPPDDWDVVIDDWDAVPPDDWDVVVDDWVAVPLMTGM